MARKFVEYEMVAEAAQKLTDAGKQPTPVALRKLVGKGSYTTISNYLKQWESENAADAEPTELELPDAIAHDGDLFIRKIYRLATASAKEQLQQERQALRDREAAIKEEMAQAVELANAATEQVEQLQEQVERLQQDNAATSKTLTQRDKELAVKTSELESARQSAEKSEAQKTESDTARQSAQQELAEAQQALVKMQAEAENAQKENKRLSTDNKKLQDNNACASASIAELREYSATVDGRLQEKTEAAEKLYEDKRAAEIRREALEKDLYEANRDVTELKHRLAKRAG